MAEFRSFIWRNFIPSFGAISFLHLAEFYIANVDGQWCTKDSCNSYNSCSIKNCGYCLAISAFRNRDGRRECYVLSLLNVEFMNTLLHTVMHDGEVSCFQSRHCKQKGLILWKSGRKHVSLRHTSERKEGEYETGCRNQSNQRSGTQSNSA